MKTNPILEELWKVKDDLAREAGYDTRRFLENLRQWEAEHQHSGPVIRSAEELRQLVAEKERQRAQESSLVLNDKPARKD
jgi:hypothetical protein